MKIKDYAPGIYTLIKEPIIAEIKVYDYYCAHIGWQAVVITRVMLRATRKCGYYIIKYNNDSRCDCINNFRVDGKNLKSYLKEKELLK